MDKKSMSGLALRRACRVGDEALAKAYLEAGAPAGEPMRSGWRATALGWASMGGHAGIVAMLAQAGADPWATARDDHVDAWRLCVAGGHVDALGAMARIAKRKFGSKGARCPLSMVAAMSGLAARSGEKSLLLAAKALVAHCDIEALDGWGMTPLMHSARNGSKAMVEMLLDAGADPNKAGVSGVTPLMLCSKSESGVCALLLAHRADRLAVDQWGATALHWAAKRGSAESIALLGEGPAVGMLDIEGKSASERADWAKAGAEARALLERAELGALSSGAGPHRSARSL
jgi:hypothetical protein